MVYNIAYGTGIQGSLKGYLFKFWRYLWIHKNTIKNITSFLQKQKADVICLIEVDTGSLRSRFKSQVKTIGEKLFYPVQLSKPKYHPKSVARVLPTVRKQHDAILSKKDGRLDVHYFTKGTKKLIQEFIIDDISIFVVHLSVLRKNLRKFQLNQLTDIIQKCPRKYVVCGDFNIHKGMYEVQDFIDQNNLKLVNLKATFPTAKPKKNIDLILVSEGISVKAAGVEQVPFSDHLPVWVEIDS
jgi:endonuclease/exonuclease/phosphatase family metal-dependent hydrolase